MIVNARLAAFMLAVMITAVSTIFVSLVKGTPAQAIVVVAFISFSSTFLLAYVTLEFLIFREIQNMYVSIDKINRKEFRLYTADVKKTSNPLRRMNREIVAYTSRKQKEIEELRRVESFRREFIADISHELKTPIFAAQGFILTLLDGAIDDVSVRDKFLRKAAKSLEGLNLLVQDLLMLSQIESGAITMNLENIDFKELMFDVFEQLEDKAARRQIKLNFEAADTVTTCVLVDSLRIMQVMMNLVGNAVKYGNENGFVSVKIYEEDEHIAVFVTDDGPGIPKQDLYRIFERFYRVEKSRSRRQGGSGLGLAIVKNILDKHESSISVTSELHKGTTFSFKLKKGVCK